MKRIEFITNDKTIKTMATVGERLLNTAEKNKIDDIYSACGGVIGCGGCLVEVVSGHCDDPSEKELDLIKAIDGADNTRLACQIYITDDMVIDVRQ